MSKIHFCLLVSSLRRTWDSCGDSICGCSYCCIGGTDVQPHCCTKGQPRRLFPRQQCSGLCGSRNIPSVLSAVETVRDPHTAQPHSRTTCISESSFLTYHHSVIPNIVSIILIPLSVRKMFLRTARMALMDSLSSNMLTRKSASMRI